MEVAGRRGGLVVLIALPQLLANAYYVQLSILVLLNAVLAMTFVLLLRAGMISLSVAGVLGHRRRTPPAC